MCADNASSHLDASSKNNVSGNVSENEDLADDQVKKRAVEVAPEELESNHNSNPDAGNKDTLDTGGNKDSCLGKNSGV